jgi:hypothetical protein
MVRQTSRKNEKVESPATTYDKPHDILKDKELSHHEKEEALNTWEQDARQLMFRQQRGNAGRRRRTKVAGSPSPRRGYARQGQDRRRPQTNAIPVVWPSRGTR